jgi:hypothetical protein
LDHKHKTTFWFSLYLPSQTSFLDYYVLLTCVHHWWCQDYWTSYDTMKSNQGLQNEHRRVINFVSLQFKEYTQSRLYQIRLNYFKPYIDLNDTQYMLRFYVWVLGMWTPSRKLHKHNKSSNHINICNQYMYQLSTVKIDAFVLSIKR